jgi:hypothetical protein
MKRNRQFSAFLLALAAVASLTVITPVLANEALSTGQTVYLPLYSHIYFGDKLREFNLTATAYIRNTDGKRRITLTAVDYYSHDGKRLKGLIDAPLAIDPFSSKNFSIKESDTSGGSGASIIVRWTSEQAANPPLVESVMIGAASTQGISFVCQGRVIESDSP